MVGKMNRKLMLTLIITLGLAACSSFKIMYDFADDYIKQEAKFFFKFESVARRQAITGPTPTSAKRARPMGTLT